jgi:hypothetical protein
MIVQLRKEEVEGKLAEPPRGMYCLRHCAYSRYCSVHSRIRLSWLAEQV